MGESSRTAQPFDDLCLKSTVQSTVTKMLKVPNSEQSIDTLYETCTIQIYHMGRKKDCKEPWKQALPAGCADTVSYDENVFGIHLKYSIKELENVKRKHTASLCPVATEIPHEKKF